MPSAGILPFETLHNGLENEGFVIPHPRSGLKPGTQKSKSTIDEMAEQLTTTPS